ncbi:MAG: hypothetical protein HC850_18300 [Rhodomicrobium sp.]|nr:hypothetical protein [Rhodomicrobium sp.]
MRDDIHKSVPRPREVQRWVKHATREADRLAGRSRAGLEDAVRLVCNRELSDRFIDSLRDRVLDGTGDLFGVIAGVRNPRELGGTGSHVERQVLSDCQRVVAEGRSGQEALTDALANVLTERSRADVRAAEPVLLPEGGRHVIAQMNEDIRAVDYRAIAAERYGFKEGPDRNNNSISADEDLLAGQPGRK